VSEESQSEFQPRVKKKVQKVGSTDGSEPFHINGADIFQRGKLKREEYFDLFKKLDFLRC